MSANVAFLVVVTCLDESATQKRRAFSDHLFLNQVLQERPKRLQGIANNIGRHHYLPFGGGHLSKMAQYPLP
jgi:hypothetical protein